MFIFFISLILVSVIVGGTMFLLSIEKVPTVSEKLAEVYKEFFPGRKSLHTVDQWNNLLKSKLIDDSDEINEKISNAIKNKMSNIEILEIMYNIGNRSGKLSKSEKSLYREVLNLKSEEELISEKLAAVFELFFPKSTSTHSPKNWVSYLNKLDSNKKEQILSTLEHMPYVSNENKLKILKAKYLIMKDSLSNAHRNIYEKLLQDNGESIN